MRHLILIALLALSACGSGRPPMSPSPSPQPAQPDVVALGGAAFPPAEDCPGGSCTYSFDLTNRGEGCARRVRGALELRNAAGAIFVSDPWGELPPSSGSRQEGPRGSRIAAS